MGVLEARHEVGLGLETTDELRAVRQLGADHLDGDDAIDRRLRGAVDDGVGPLADPLEETVSTHRAGIARRWRRRQRTRGNRELELADLLAGFEPEVGSEPVAVLLVGTKRLGLAT